MRIDSQPDPITLLEDLKFGRLAKGSPKKIILKRRGQDLSLSLRPTSHLKTVDYGSDHEYHAQKLRRIEKHITEIANLQKDEEMPNYDSRPPFFKRIMEEIIPRHFKIF